MTQRVLYVNTPTYLGGAEVSLLTLMEHLESDRYGAVLLTAGESTLGERAQAAGIPVHTQEFPWFSRRRFWEYPSSICRLARTIRGQAISVVHTNCDHSLRYVMHATRIARAAYVSHVRDFVRGWFEPDTLEALNHAARVIANSEATASVCIDRGVEANRVTTVYNPIDLAAFRGSSVTDRERFGEEIGVSAGALLVGIVGQIQEIKGHKEFLEAALRLCADFPGLHFAIVGAAHGQASRDFLSGLRKTVVESGWSERFHFTGFRDDIPAVMSALDILAVPAWSESFGRVAVEGMAAGCPVIAADAGGLSEIVTDGVDALLVPPRNIDALVGALRRLCTDSTLRNRLSRRGPASAKRFSADRHVSRMQAIYDSVLSGGRG